MRSSSTSTEDGRTVENVLVTRENLKLLVYNFTHFTSEIL